MNCLVERLRRCRWIDPETGAYTHKYDIAGVESERLETADRIEELEAIKDKAENLLIAIDMGWDMDGVIDALKAALKQGESNG